MTLRSGFSLAMLALLALTWPALAGPPPGEPLLVRDINDVLGSNENPREIVPLDSNRVALLYGPGNLALSDGTTAGTSIAARTGRNDARNLVPIGNGRALFSATTSTHVTQLWATDGTESGTVPIGTLFVQPSQIVAFGGQGYFVARQTDRTPCAFWSTNGTYLGTKILTELALPSTSCPSSLSILNFQFYFPYEGGLWRSDGTSAAPTLVAAGSSFPSWRIANLGERLLFTLGNETGGRQLWAADSRGATLLKELDAVRPGAAVASEFLVVNGVGYFAIGNGVRDLNLWRSDGTASGTYRVSDVSLDYPPSMGAGNSALYFVAEYPPVIWRLDLLTGVAERIPSTVSQSGQPRSLRPLGDDLLYVSTGPSGEELWKLDGATRQTVMLKDIFPGPTGSGPAGLTVFRDRLLFVATSPASGRELWTSDGTVSGTRQIANLGSDGTASSDPSDALSTGSNTFFLATDAFKRRGLWITDGTETGTRFVTAAPPNPPGWVLAPLASRLYFTLNDRELWSTDGRALSREATANELGAMEALQGKLYFSSFFNGQSFDPATRRIENIGASGTLLDAIESVWIVDEPGLYRTDGTADGTFALSLLPKVSTSSSSTIDVWMGGRAFRFAGSEMYVSYGGPDGYRLVTQALPSVSKAVATSRLIFLITSGSELWVTDGTAAGARQLFSSNLGLISGHVEMATLADTLYFAAHDSHGEELWRSDGTPSGTFMMGDINPGTASSSPRSLTPIDGYLFFSAVDSFTGRELWRADANSEITRVSDLETGSKSSNPSNFASIDGGVLFSATTTETGTEPWALPPEESPSISIADTWSAEGGNAVARIVLSRPATRPLTVDYRTIQGTALAGADYPATEGSVAIGTGELYKDIVIPILNDEEPEPYEAFSIALTSTGRLHKSSATVLITPSDPATVDLTTDVLPVREGEFLIRVRNNGQTAATNISLSRSSTSSAIDVKASHCLRNSSAYTRGCTIAALKPGETVDIPSTFYLSPSSVGSPEVDSILTLAAFAREEDQHPSDNVLSLSGARGSRIFLRGLFVPLGDQQSAYVWRSGSGNVVKLGSSDPSIASVPEQIVIPDGQAWGTFSISGGSKAGSVTITATYEGGASTSVSLPVSDPQTPPKVSPPVTVRRDGGGSGDGYVGEYVDLRVDVGLGNPHEPTPEGEVRLLNRGIEIARATLVGGSALFRLRLARDSYYFAAAYGGDGHNLPAKSADFALSVSQATTLFQYTCTEAARPGDLVELRFQVVGGPLQVPTGSVEVSDGSGVIATAPLSPGGPAGEATARIELTSLIEGSHYFKAVYSGDDGYKPATLDVSIEVIGAQRRRGVRR